MTPKAWSHSALEDFKSCPRSYYEKRIAKSVVETKGEATIWGEEVHKHFEEFLRDGVALPAALQMHEEFLLGLHQLPGQAYIEEQIALDTRAQPCGFFDSERQVWVRGIIDYKKVNGTHALIVDHKTGKMKPKWGQLMLFALHTFAAHPEVETVDAKFYWTQLRSTNGHVYNRGMIPELWKHFMPDLRQYAEAYKTDTWQPRQSGLCNGWCPVTACEFWKPKRVR